MIFDIDGPPRGSAASLSECERALEPTFRMMLAELARLLGSNREAAEELAGSVVLPSEYTLAASWIEMLRFSASRIGWDARTVEKAMPSLAARVTIPVFKDESGAELATEADHGSSEGSRRSH